MTGTVRSIDLQLVNSIEVSHHVIAWKNVVGNGSVPFILKYGGVQMQLQELYPTNNLPLHP
jgi:hypothetical protein